MSEKSAEIRDLMRRICAKPMSVFIATVTAEVDEETLTVEVKPIGQAEIDQVRLKAAIDGLKDGVVEYPEKDSTVLCGIIGDDEDICFVLKCSKVNKTLINGGLNGGLINITTLVDELNKTNEAVTAIMDIMNGSAIPEPGSGAPSALQAAVKAALVGKELGDYSQMEDETVKH